MQEAPERGIHFEKREYRDTPLPEWLVERLRLPAPALDGAPEVIEAYWKAWEAAFAHFHRPRLGSRLVSNFLDPMADGVLRLWDACVMASFCDLAHDIVPGIRALDNFYACQHADGEICREIDLQGQDVQTWVNVEGRPLFSRQTGRAADLGRPAPVPPPDLTLDGMAHPLAAWAEAESYRQTGDAERVAMVWPALVHLHDALRTHLRHENGLYVTDWSWMDNSPRNIRLACGVDAACEMVLFARSVAELGPVAARMAEAAGRFPQGLAARRRATAAAAEAEALAAVIRERLWDGGRGFFFDLRQDGTLSEVPTAAAFWTLAAGVASPEQTDRLCALLEDPAAFGRPAGVPSLSAAAAGYDPRGGYFRGAVWPPLMLMVARGLARCGRPALARRVAMRHVEAAAQVARETGTFFDNYAPDEAAPGRPARAGFVGWGGVGPITLLLEFGIGLRGNAPLEEVRWNVETLQECGCDRYLVGPTRVKVHAEARRDFAEPLRVSVEAERPIRLVVETAGRRGEFRVTGRQAYTV